MNSPMKRLLSPVGARIREARTAQKLSQAKLSVRIWGDATKQSRIANWETGRNEPGYNDLYRVAQALGVTVDFFLSDRPLNLAQQPAISVFGLGEEGMKSKGHMPLFWPIQVSKKAFGLLIDGDEYAPKIHPGECLLIDPNEIPAIGDIVLIKVSSPNPVLASLVSQTAKDRTFNILGTKNVISLKRSDASSFLGVVISRIISDRKFLF